ncbi:hypothetical protein MPER_09213, partial [Moniliophthora perniciosa FA553]
MHTNKGVTAFATNAEQLKPQWQGFAYVGVVYMTTQYCSQECQKIHWRGHKPICQHTKSQPAKIAAAYVSPDENVARNLRKFTSAHTTLLGWAGFQALQLKRVPSNIRQNALLVELSPQNHPESHRRFRIACYAYVPRKT